ncbi:hypothetical protein QFZ73_000421 [Peribacillus sp. V2I11]|nr:hypothetical protein [Peribacillus sp. V2I11]
MIIEKTLKRHSVAFLTWSVIKNEQCMEPANKKAKKNRANPV